MNGFDDVVQLLVGAGADMGAVMEDGLTPLLLAASQGHTHVLEVLLAQQVSLAQTDDAGHTALHLAAIAGSTDCLEVLLSVIGAAAAAAAAAASAAAAAASPSPPDILDQRDQSGKTALMLASLHGHTAVLRLLLERHASVGPADNDARTALHHAVERADTEAVAMLLDARADPNTRGQGGYSALHLAASLGMCSGEEMSWADVVTRNGGQGQVATAAQGERQHRQRHERHAADVCGRRRPRHHRTAPAGCGRGRQRLRPQRLLAAVLRPGKQRHRAVRRCWPVQAERGADGAATGC
jgi:hypothetical protein